MKIGIVLPCLCNVDCETLLDTAQHPAACRRHLNVRGKSANLPAITDKDWEDIKFGVDVGVDYYALSFVRSADVIYELKRYLSKQDAKIGVLAKIESADSVQVRAAAALSSA